MTTTPPPPDAPRRKRTKDRRAPPGKPGSLRWLKGMLGRPVVVELHGMTPQVVLVERRRQRQRPTLASLCAELGRCLAGRAAAGAAPLPRLASFGEELARTGWSGARAMPPAVLGTARAEAEALAGDDPSPLMKVLVERLQILQVGAVLREQRAARGKAAREELAPEVREVTQEEFDALAKSWADTVSPGLQASAAGGPDGDDSRESVAPANA
jgi:hypothetical protein